jgi:signal transduction histidine kinase
MSLPETRLPAAWRRTGRSSGLSTQIVRHVVEPPVLAQKAAAAFREATGLPFVGVALREPSGVYAMHGVSGARHPALLRKIRVAAGKGLGGRAIALGRSVAVSDYRRDSLITADFLPLAAAEGLRAMTAVPIGRAGDVVGLLYGASRGADVLGDGIRAELEALGAEIAVVVGTAVDHTAALARQAAVQRELIAQELHDGIGPILFALGVSARSLRAEPGDRRDAVHRSAEIERQVKEATRALRDALRVLGHQAPEDDLPVAIRIDMDAFTHRSGIPAQLMVQGGPRAVGGDEECILLAVLRAALHNVEEHAHAGLVVVTLHYRPDAVELVVQDDGVGLPDGFVLRPRHRHDRGWGVSSMLRRVQQHGGRLEVRPAPDRGTIVRAELRAVRG